MPSWGCTLCSPTQPYCVARVRTSLSSASSASLAGSGRVGMETGRRAPDSSTTCTWGRAASQALSCAVLWGIRSTRDLLLGLWGVEAVPIPFVAALCPPVRGHKAPLAWRHLTGAGARGQWAFVRVEVMRREGVLRDEGSVTGPAA